MKVKTSLPLSGNGVTGLPALPGSLTSSPDIRLRRVHSHSDLLPSLGVRTTPADEGHVAIRLPAEMAELFLLDLEQRAKEWQEAMRKTRILEIRRAAELEAASGEALRAFEAEQDGWAEEYEKLRAQGEGHRARGGNRGPPAKVPTPLPH